MTGFNPVIFYSSPKGLIKDEKGSILKERAKNKFMREKIKKFIKQYLGAIMIIIGTGLCAYNIFGFSYRTSYGLRLPAVGAEKIVGVAYFYYPNTLLSISIGAMLIVSGILIIKNKYKSRGLN